MSDTKPAESSNQDAITITFQGVELNKFRHLVGWSASHSHDWSPDATRAFDALSMPTTTEDTESITAPRSDVLQAVYLYIDALTNPLGGSEASPEWWAILNSVLAQMKEEGKRLSDEEWQRIESKGVGNGA